MVGDRKSWPNSGDPGRQLCLRAIEPRESGNTEVPYKHVESM